jgi:chemotaxis methyl-accepting protein methylase
VRVPPPGSAEWQENEGLATLGAVPGQGPSPSFSPGGAEQRDQEALERVLERLVQQSGVDLLSYKPSVLRRRLAQRARALGLGGLEDYDRLLARRVGESAAFMPRLLNQTTSMFRHPGSTSVLRAHALPSLLARRAAEGARSVRAWVAGCSSGEEAYSLSMCLLEARERVGSDLELVVFATDIDDAALARASRGIVSAESGARVPAELASRWLSSSEQEHRICGEARSIVSFSRHDLLAPGAPAPRSAVLASFDLVSCCNVLIYLQPEARRRVLARLVSACEPGSLLVLGRAERALDAPEGALSELESGIPVYRVA